MNATPEQKARFKDMVRNFAAKNHLQYRFHEESNAPHCICVHLRRTSSVCWGEWLVNFNEVRSLTDAGVAVFTDASIKFNLGPACPDCATKTPAIVNVIYNPPATVVFWSDGGKTVVKCGKNDEFDPEKGLAMAISKKMLGNQGNYYNEFKKWAGKYDAATEEVESEYPPRCHPRVRYGQCPKQRAELFAAYCRRCSGMKTVGDVMDEIEKIQKTIRELTPMCDNPNSGALVNAICLLANYRETLRDLPLKK